MKKFKYDLLAVVVTMFVMTGFTNALADGLQQGRNYTITIINITPGQIFSPPVVVVHDRNFKLFELGVSADEPLYSMAEDGLTDPIENYLDGLEAVFDHNVAQGPVLPGESVSIEVTARGRFKFISVAGMLVSTNDAFFAVRGLPIHVNRTNSVSAKAYDAGSEANLEDCGHIPGPPCGNGGVRNTAEAEGFIHIHSGIHGQGDLDPVSYDWNNPVAKITVSSGY